MWKDFHAGCYQCFSHPLSWSPWWMEIHYFGLYKIRPPPKKNKKKNHFNKINKIQKENQILIKGDRTLKFIKPGTRNILRRLGRVKTLRCWENFWLLSTTFPWGRSQTDRNIGMDTSTNAAKIAQGGKEGERNIKIINVLRRLLVHFSFLHVRWLLQGIL